MRVARAACILFGTPTNSAGRSITRVPSKSKSGSTGSDSPLRVELGAPVTSSWIIVALSSSLMSLKLAKSSTRGASLALASFGPCPPAALRVAESGSWLRPTSSDGGSFDVERFDHSAPRLSNGATVSRSASQPASSRAIVEIQRANSAHDARVAERAIIPRSSARPSSAGRSGRSASSGVAEAPGAGRSSPVRRARNSSVTPYESERDERFPA